MPISFAERYDRARPSYVKVNAKRFADLDAGSTVLVPSPADIERELRYVAVGELINLTELRRRLATRHDADGTCPVMTGMHLRVVAEVAFEAIDRGVPVRDVAPIWRVVSPHSALAAKLPDGPARIATLRTEAALALPSPR